MEVFRISKCIYIDDLTGTGAMLYGGRWNLEGTRVVYTACSRSLAALETLVHIPQKNLPKDFCIATIFIPDDLPVKTFTDEDLPLGWNRIPVQEIAQTFADSWISGGEFAVFKFPSVVIKQECNFLINPLHPDAKKIHKIKSEKFLFDERIIQ